MWTGPIYQAVFKTTIFLTLGLCLVHCVPEDPDVEPFSFEYKPTDTTLVNIYNQGVEGAVSEVLPYLNHARPIYRWMALNALSNPGVDFPVDSLIPLLADPQLEVRTMAAFALGQTHNQRAHAALVQSFDNADSLFQNVAFNTAVLEAVGKTGDARTALQLADIQSYLPGDSSLNIGRLRGLYHLGQKGTVLPEVKAFMIEVVGNKLYPVPARILAADFLIRFVESPIDTNQFQLIRAFEKNRHPELSVFLSRLLPSCTSPKAAEALRSAVRDEGLKAHLNHETARALLQIPSSENETLFSQLLQNEEPQLQTIAAQYFYQHGKENDALQYRKVAQNTSLSLEARAWLYGATLQHLPFYYQLTRTTLLRELKQVIRGTANPFERGLLIGQLQWEPPAAKWLIDLRQNEKQQFIHLKVTETLLQMLQHPQWNELLGGRANFTRGIILEDFKSILKSDRIGCIAALAKGMRSRAEQFSGFISNQKGKLKELHQKLPLPEASEAAFEIENLFEEIGEPIPSRVAPLKQRGAQLNLLSAWTDSSLLEIHCEDGIMELQLFPQQAPASVSALLENVADGYYDGKIWHRVVENFVVQGGCPIGNGYGSGPFLLPTETAPVHFDRKGRVGLASMGPNTESVQFFITHLPTPHLDGKYAIIGQLVSGWDVLEQINQGDTIQKIELKNTAIDL